MNSAAEINALIEDLEKKFPVSEWTVDDIHVWPLIRIDLASRLVKKVLQFEQTKSPGLLQNLLNIFKFSIKAVSVNRSAFKALKNMGSRRVLYFDDGVSYAKLGGVDFFKSFEALKVFFKKKDVDSFVVSYGYQYSTHALLPIYLLQPLIDCARVKHHLLLRLKIASAARVHLPMYAEFKKALREKGIDVSPFEEQALIPRIQLMKRISENYAKLLKKIQPKAVFFNCYYGYQAMALVNACRMLNIPTFDVQHGVAGEAHRAYRKWLNVPQDGYSFIPDYFLSWSAADAEAVNSWSGGISRHKAFFTGNLFYELFKANNVLDFDMNRDLAVDVSGYKIETKKNILVTLGWGSDLRSTYSEIWKFGALAQNQYNFYIRLHPVMKNEAGTLRAIIKEFGFEKCDIERATSMPMALLIPQMDLHITNYSAAALDVASFGRRTLLVSEYGVQVLAPNMADDMWRLTKTAPEIQNEVASYFASESSLAKTGAADHERRDNLETISKIVLDRA